MILYIIKVNYRYLLFFIIPLILLLCNPLHEIKGNEGKVTRVNTSSYEIKSDHQTFLLKTKTSLELGDHIKFNNAKQTKITGASNFGGFDYRLYMLSKKINRQITSEVKVISHHPQVQTKLLNKLSKYENVATYSKLLLLGFKDEAASDLYKQYQTLGIVYLFVISGFHFNLIYQGCLKVLSRLGPIEYFRIVVIILLFIYLWILQFSIPSLRAFLVILIGYLNSQFKLKLNSTQILSGAGIIMIVSNPYIVLSMSFIMTFFISFVIVVIPDSFKKWYLYPLILFLCMAPLIITMSYEINWLSIILGLLYTPIVVLLIPLLVISNIIPLIGFLVESLLVLLNNLSSYFNSLNTSLLFGKMSYFVYLPYYLFIGLWLYYPAKMKWLTMLVVYILILYFKPNLLYKVTMLDVGQGESIVIQQPLSNKAMMIDTGGLKYMDVATTITIPFLKAQKIKAVDVIISHDDFDHSGSLKSLQTNYQVDHIYQEKVKQINSGLIDYYQLLDHITYPESNQNSLVVYTKINGLNYLFTGDIPAKVELDIINQYEAFKIDVLKVGHHGSKTSSSPRFIESLTPKYCLISVGENNYYGHPHQEVVQTLGDYECRIFQTNVNGAIQIIGIFNFNVIIYKKT